MTDSPATHTTTDRPSPVTRRASAWVVAGMLALVALLPACGGVGSQCANLCERRRDCVNGSLDVGGCEDKCSEWADESEANETRLESCDECLAQNDACSDTVRRCSADCVVIPGL